MIGDLFIGKDDVTMILGDNIFEDDFSESIKKFESGGHIFARKVPDPERYGVVKFDDNGKVLRIEEKPEKWISDYAIPGLYVFDSRCIEAAKTAVPSERGEKEITSIHNYYLEKEELTVSTFEGAWLDAGTFDSLLEAGNIVKEKEIYKQFDPIINKAIEEFSVELKVLAKKHLM